METLFNEGLLEYVEKEIFPLYELNDEAHNFKHINYVIKRSLKFAENIKDINLDMVYTIASYHDIGHHIDHLNHEKVSAEILYKDENLKKYFNKEEINIMKEAIEDHRASATNHPRSIYGKIVSSADRNTLVDKHLERTYLYITKDMNNLGDIIIDAIGHTIKKFGEEGYGAHKMYFEDKEYDEFLREIRELTNNEKAFTKRFKKVNNI